MVVVLYTLESENGKEEAGRKGASGDAGVWECITVTRLLCLPS